MPRGNNKYPTAVRKQAIRLYDKDGWGCKKIADTIGCTPSTVRKWIDQAGIHRHDGPAYSKEFREQVIADYQASDHMSLDNLAKEYEIAPHTLHRWLRDAGIRTRPQRPRVHDRDAILADLKAGVLTKREIAEKHGCSESWVYRVQRGDG